MPPRITIYIQHTHVEWWVAEARDDEKGFALMSRKSTTMSTAITVLLADMLKDFGPVTIMSIQTV